MVLQRAKQITSKLKQLRPGSKSGQLTPERVQPSLDYIQAYWHKLRRYNPKDDENLIGLPKPYLVPSFEEGHEFDYEELYYWDSYFMVKGITDEHHKELVMGILDNLVYLFKRFKIIPNGSRLYYVSRSQPPFLTSFIWDVYEAYNPGKRWLKKMMKVAEAEYHTVWMGTRKPNARQVHQGLSRYYDFNYLHDIAEAESGWDMTPRFDRKALNYLPVDLNALLYKYEMDFARYYELVGDKKNASSWKAAAHKRVDAMERLMWSSLRGFYYDYDYTKNRRGSVSSLAAYYPMYAGMVTQERAAKLVKALKRFENKGGLAATDMAQLNKYVPGVTFMPTQWAHPNGWAPLHYIVIEGLERYGYHDDARRIALKWLKTNLEWFERNGIFLEKYNVVNPEKPPEKGVYPSQTGFGWTNGIFTYLAQKYLDA